MKKRSLLLMAILGIVTLFSACSKDDVDARDEYIGTWRANESFTFAGQTFTDNYTFTITKSSSNSNTILMVGFAGASNETITATVSGNSFTIPQQTITTEGESVGISGSGSVSGNSLTFSYNGSFTNISINVNGTATKL